MSVIILEEESLRRLVREEVELALEPVTAALAQQNGAQAKERNDTLMTRQEVVDLLRIDARTLRRLEREGAVPPAIRLSDRTLRWKRRDIEKLLNDQG